MGITTHILDTAKGKPVSGLAVILSLQSKEGGWRELARGLSNADGRMADWKETRLEKGNYRLVFATAAVSSFYPQVTVEFFVSDPDQHYHVPLLLSPFGYSTYRGS